MKIKIGITGGIGSGKSIVSHLFEIMGIPVYDSDNESKRLTATDPHIREKLTSLLGKKAYLGGELNKPYLASYIFSNENHLKTINNIIHPRVKEDFHSWGDKHPSHPIVAMESAIILEAGFKEDVNVVLMVYAPLEVRIERIMKRNNFSRKQVTERIRSQMNDEEKRLKADYVILNDGNALLIPQVEKFIRELRTSYAL